MTRLTRGLTFALVLQLVAGCESLGLQDDKQETDVAGEAAVAESTQPPAVAPKEGLPARQRLRKAISLLERGQAERARIELEAYQRAVPNSKAAADLLEQIAADPVALLGRENYDYTLRSGESLYTIARDHLGDPLKFYALARYNDIDTPSEVAAGRTIKIPGEPPSAARPTPESAPAESAESPQASAPEAAAEEPRKSAAAELPQTPAAADAEQRRLEAESLAMFAEGFAASGDYQDAANLLEEGMVEFPESAKIKRLAADTYAEQAAALTEKGRHEEAQQALQRAAALAPDDRSITDRLAAEDGRVRADALYREGIEHLENDAAIEAYEAFARVVEIAPEHEPALEKLAELKPAVAEAYHRRALLAFRRQNLDQALDLWDRALQADPDHAQAATYRVQALELKARLNPPKNQ